MLLRASESGVRGHRQVLSGMCVNVDVSEVVWRSQPRARSSILRYTLEAGSARLAQKMDMYITSNMAELPKMLERRDTSEPRAHKKGGEKACNCTSWLWSGQKCSFVPKYTFHSRLQTNCEVFKWVPSM